MSFGAGVGVGTGVGCLAYLIGAGIFLAGMSVVANVFGAIWPFILIVVIAVVLMFFPRTRPIATGILIVSAAAWIIVIGPCLGLISGSFAG